MGVMFVNHQEVFFRDPTKNLLRFIREDLKLKGAKDGCGIGRCGACTILLNGSLKRACRLNVGDVEGKEVLTIEGLGSKKSLHPIQLAFIESGAIQCGFCTPGMILATKALLDKDPNPNDEKIKKALSANLCRCTGYNTIITAVKLAVHYLKIGQAEAEKLLAKEKAGGNKVPRKDAVDKALGASIFGDDLDIPGSLYAGIVRSPHPHAKILGIDYQGALLHHGVVDVWTAKDVPGTNYYHSFIKDQPVVAKDIVRYEGEPVAVVVAKSRDGVKEGVKKVKVVYEPLNPIFDMEKSLASAQKIHENGNVVIERHLKTGNSELAFRDAKVFAEGSFYTPCVEHAYLEPDAGTAYIDEEGIITVFGPTQAPHIHRDGIAHFLNVNPEKVRMQQCTIGGGFGSKADISIQCFIALSAVRTKRPVKMVYTREETFQVTVKRHPFRIHGKICGTRTGKITGLWMDILADTGAYSAQGPPVITRSIYHAAGPYAIPNVSINGKLVYTNNPNSSAMRGFGVPQVTFAMESLVDIFAQKCEMDPVVVREINALLPGKFTVFGHQVGEDAGFLESLKVVKNRHEQLKDTLDNSNSSIKKGLGIASLWYGIGGTNVPNKAESKIVLQENGKFMIYSGTTEIGQGANTIYAEIAAQLLNQQSIDNIDVITGDSLLCPDSLATNASRQTYLYGNALSFACKDIELKILTLASEKNKVDVNDLELVQDGINIKPTGEILPFSKLVDKPIMGYGKFEPELPKLLDGKSAPYRVYSFGTVLAEVTVNTDTGKVKVDRVVGSYDCGKIANIEFAKGQCDGGVLMGLGYALQEEFIVGKSHNFDTYKIPTFRDSCDIETTFVHGPRLDGPLGVKGLGEIPLLSVAPAIINAIDNACGVRICSLPATKEKIMAGLEK